MTEWNTPEVDELLMSTRPRVVAVSLALAHALRRGDSLSGVTEADMRAKWLTGDPEDRGAEIDLDGAAPLLGLTSVVLRPNGEMLRLVRTTLGGAVTESWELDLSPELVNTEARLNWLGTWKKVVGFAPDIPSWAAGPPDEVAAAIESLTERLLWVLGGTR